MNIVAIIAGSRKYTKHEHYKLVKRAVKKSGWKGEISIIITGGAAGIDAWGSLYALDNEIDHIIVNANWKRHGKKAGPIRNDEMATIALVLADRHNLRAGLIAIPGFGSKGTWNMVKIAKEREMEVFVYKEHLVVDGGKKHKKKDVSAGTSNESFNFLAEQDTEAKSRRKRQGKSKKKQR